ncbi:lysophospholipid acyltransferase family protein [Papillibacter cinnamivorans]|uniref:1-acyl-sn-glycerol-3-phosphate acyltransferase n=1 Tax=Papillibacter cinnamivorans DSM 12816 TaxID=1122930 RepID=A0A1W1YUR5_9FIRM|nr:lysophospholipid acyltransferase family protein [Papillibacter cinnamivorans]SMC39945.1 1-acyl-sn-glycerol-3-phosphate acyltransferase [Papillibacter cinnamivorans DSM 12816]
MNRIYRILYALVWPFFNLVYRADAMGRENIPQGAALVCGNHSGLSDPLLVVFAFHSVFPLRVMAKEELMRLPILGWLLKKAGIFSVRRGRSDVAAIKTALRFLKNGDKVLIFPEGHRMDEENAANAKTGAAMLAVRAGVPILPVYIAPKKKAFGRVRVIIGKPFYPQVAGRKATADDYRVIAGEIMNRVYALPEAE